MDGRTVLWDWADGLPEGASVEATLTALRAVLLDKRADTPGPSEVRAVYDAAERRGRPAGFHVITDADRERAREHLGRIRRQLHHVA